MATPANISLPAYSAASGDAANVQLLGDRELSLLIKQLDAETFELKIHVLANASMPLETIAAHRKHIHQFIEQYCAQHPLQRRMVFSVSTANPHASDTLVYRTMLVVGAAQDSIKKILASKFPNLRIGLSLDDLQTREPISQDNTAQPQPALKHTIAEFLKRNGIDDPQTAAWLNKFVTEEIPDAEAIEAMQKLRKQFHQGQVTGKPKYPGRHIDAIDYLIEHYGNDIYEELLRPGQLQTRDAYLYLSVRAMLDNPQAMQKHFPDGTPPKTMNELFGRLSQRGKVISPLEVRYEACAKILGTTKAEAAKFFGNLRRSRVKGESESFR